MTRGRKPKPTVLKILAGNPGKRKLNTNEPKPEEAKGDAIKPPYSLPSQGKRLWRLWVPQLSKLGMLNKLNLAALEGACTAYARALQADAIVKKQGTIVMTKTGYPVQHPSVAIARLSWQTYLKFATEFGGTPSSISRMKVTAAPPGADSDEDFLFGRKAASQ